MVLEITSNIVAIFLAVYLAILHPLLQQPILVVIGLGLLSAINLGLAWLHRERWFLFPSAILLVLMFLFILLFAPGGKPESLIVIFTFAAVIYGLLGFWIRRSGDEKWAEPLEAAAVVVGLFCGVVALIDGTSIGLNALVVAVIAYAILFVSTRENGYIYLIFLFAGAIGFQFLRISGERYSPELVDQFLIGLGIIGIVFAYPLIRSMLRREGSIKDWFNAGGWPRALLIGLPMLMIVVISGLSYTVEATANPTFCGSCHVMQNQFQAWDQSPHRDVSCDTCHYPQGIEHFIQGKIVGLVEVVSNVAGTYDANQHGTVDNANCEACHAIDDLIGVPSPYRGAIHFNHTELAPEMNSGITMRCNNCHSHIVDGYHFQVRESTCYWCHFMGREGQSSALGTCFDCHEVPYDYTHIGVVTTDNEADCTVSGCHDGVTVGDGAARPERCLSCHGMIDPRAGDAQAMHDFHIVSDTTFLSRKVECLECHDEITHGEEEFDMLLFYYGQ
jgi:nitrate/TMAO reductase-like tetraheme cytochrome c subunit